MIDIIQTLPNQWITIATSVIAVASAISAVTPTPKAGSKLAQVYKVIDFLALNIGKAKQK
jgi:hypothetical protein